MEDTDTEEATNEAEASEEEGSNGLWTWTSGGLLGS